MPASGAIRAARSTKQSRSVAGVTGSALIEFSTVLRQMLQLARRCIVIWPTVRTFKCNLYKWHVPKNQADPAPSLWPRGTRTQAPTNRRPQLEPCHGKLGLRLICRLRIRAQAIHRARTHTQEKLRNCQSCRACMARKYTKALSRLHRIRLGFRPLSTCAAVSFAC